MRIGVYPGSFDPITNGHLDILARSLGIFDQVCLAVARENHKACLFTMAERTELIQESIRDIPATSVESFSGLLVDFARDRGACAIIRGLRVVSDFDYEFQLSLMNRRLEPSLESVFLMTSVENSFISSSMIKQVAALGGELSGLVPPHVEQALRRKYDVF